MAFGWVLLTLVLLAVATLVSRARMYRRLFGPDHFIELGRALTGVRAAALDQITDEEGAVPRARNDPRAVATSSGLVVVYTVWKRGTEFVHHCSVGAARSVTAHAVGETFLLFAARVLGLPIEKMTFRIADTTIHHGEVVMDEDAHRAFVAAPPVEVTRNNVADLHRRAMEARTLVRWH